MVIDTDCTTCDGLGTLGIDPDTNERIYCDACQEGLLLHKQAILTEGESIQEWLKTYGERLYYQAERVGMERREGQLIAEYDEILALLDTLKQDETNRPRAHLFEDA